MNVACGHQNETTVSHRAVLLQAETTGLLMYGLEMGLLVGGDSVKSAEKISIKEFIQMGKGSHARQRVRRLKTRVQLNLGAKELY